MLSTRAGFAGEFFVQLSFMQNKAAFSRLSDCNGYSGAMYTTALFRGRNTLPALTASFEGEVSRENGICLNFEIESPLGARNRADGATMVFNKLRKDACLLVDEQYRIFAAFSGIDFNHGFHDFLRRMSTTGRGLPAQHGQFSASF